MRLLLPLLVVLGALAVASCEDTPAATTSPIKLGKMSVEEFRADPSYAIWFDVQYAGYPGSGSTELARFNSNAQRIADAFDPARHRVIMVVKPTCSCKNTKLYMPQVMRTLDVAGIPHSNVDIWVSDTQLNGFDELKNTHQPAITVVPTFIVTKDGVEKGRITDKPADGSQVDIDLAAIFALP